MTDATRVSTRDYLLPVVFGVTGHRNLRPGDEPELEKSVRGIFAEMRRLYPETPLLLLSPLAEGADQLVARVAKVAGASLLVPLPMPKAAYERTFDTEQGLKAFRELYAEADTVFTLAAPEPPEDGESSEGDEAAFARVGRFVAENSHTLIALWDGDKTDDRKGTAWVVAYKLGEGEAGIRRTRPLDPPEEPNVLHVVTPRRGGKKPAAEPFTVITLPEGDAEKVPAARREELLKRTNTYNREVTRFVERNPAAVAKHAAGPLREEREHKLPPACLSLLHRFAAASALAERQQLRAFVAWVAILVLVVSGFVLFQVSLELPAVLVLALIYPTSLLAGSLIKSLASRGGYQHKHMDYRALAEGLRLSLFWKLMGVADSVSDEYLRQQRSELDWIREAVRAADVESLRAVSRGGDPLVTVSPTPGHCRLLLETWVKDQHDFYANAARRDDQLDRRLVRIAEVLFWIGVVAASVLGGYAALGLWWPKLGIELSGGWHHVLAITVGVALAIGVALRTHAETLLLAEHARQYDQMAGLFGRASERVEAAVERNDLALVTRIVRQLGHEALAENGSWIHAHRARPIHVPRG